MLYVLMCRDKPESLSVRLATRDAHLAYAATQADMIRLAGPLLSDDAETMAGSLFIIEADSADEVRAFHQADPYTLAELWESVALHPFRQVVPKP
jgi:uncharacterized protein